jgi:catechol-2,3-dioxygenase
MLRIFPPTRYDKAPYRQIDYVKDEEGSGIEYYIQLNDNEDEPQWELLGDFFVKVFKDKLADQCFIDECIRKYHGN